MSGWLTNGLDNLVTFSGNEQLPLDLETAAGAAPLTASSNLYMLAMALQFYGQTASHATVIGTRYYVGPYTIGTAIGGNDVVNQVAPLLLNGVNVKVGATGGTDSWVVYLYNSAGVLVASSNTAGVTAGAAGLWQQIPFYSGSAATPYSAAPGQYYVALQSGGATATFAAINAPTYPLFTGSATGSFGVGGSITPPTTYTASVGPQAWFY